jgi:hypothetical protein
MATTLAACVHGFTKFLGRASRQPILVKNADIRASVHATIEVGEKRKTSGELKSRAKGENPVNELQYLEIFIIVR